MLGDAISICRNSLHKAIIFIFVFFLATTNIVAQGTPPPNQGNNGPIVTNDGPPDPPGAPLDSNAIYILLTGGLLFLLYSNRKKILINTDKSN
jgi:hypothetical protein